MIPFNESFNEDFLQFVWKFQLLDTSNLSTHLNEKIEIVHPGTHNVNESGPDFMNAKIKIGETLWAGNVEIHKSIQDWKAHKHQFDKAYNNLILHVVYAKPPLPITTESGIEVPTIVIKERIFPQTLVKYQHMLEQKPKFIPCENLFQPSSNFLFTQYYESLLFERLERKVNDIQKDVAFFKGSLDDAFLIALFKYFGAPANKQPFEILARSIKLHQIIKQATSVEQVEALLFGLAGLLNGQDEYAQKLENEFEFLKSMYKLETILDTRNWKFSNVRPPNFPTVRLAQLSALLYKEQRLLNAILQIPSKNKFYEMFQSGTSIYWETHFNFGKSSKKSEKKLTKAFCNKIMINVVAPFLFFYGKYKGEEKYIEQSIDLLSEIEVEKNSIIQNYKNLDWPVENAFDSQALLELNNNYCKPKKCLDCRIGYEVLSLKSNKSK